MSSCVTGNLRGRYHFSRRQLHRALGQPHRAFYRTAGSLSHRFYADAVAGGPSGGRIRPLERRLLYGSDRAEGRVRPCAAGIALILEMLMHKALDPEPWSFDFRFRNGTLTWHLLTSSLRFLAFFPV